MYGCTVRFETRIPSLSNSPRSRSAPHLWFRAAISRISVAWRVGLRPRARDRHRHRRRKPSRCHRSTVAGCTSVTVARHEAVHLVSSAIVKRCEPVNITRLHCSRLFAAASCCRRSSFSATSDVRERNCRTTSPTRAPSIAAEYQEEEAPGAGSARFQESSQDGCPRDCRRSRHTRMHLGRHAGVRTCRLSRSRLRL